MVVRAPSVTSTASPALGACEHATKEAGQKQAQIARPIDHLALRLGRGTHALKCTRAVFNFPRCAICLRVSSTSLRGPLGTLVTNTGKVDVWYSTRSNSLTEHGFEKGDLGQL